jgi:hypothetical protein
VQAAVCRSILESSVFRRVGGPHSWRWCGCCYAWVSFYWVIQR